MCKGTIGDEVPAREKLTVKALFTTVLALPVFKLVFLHYLCFHLHSPIEIKERALNFMFACVNYRKI